MQISSGLTGCAGLVNPKLPFQIQKYNRSTPRDYNVIQLVSKRVTYEVTQLTSKRIPRAKIHYFLAPSFCTRYTTSAGRNHHELSFGDDFLEEPIWLTPIKEALLYSEDSFSHSPSRGTSYSCTRLS
ncbi:hypothetical protein LOK49_LG02G03965 [Camellia lanceoleosa]|uniref:Uncharacterized protein n=1 Tax=Camellia lanceoleosa TaxID=1840588 RepID=A0ACC0IHR8_9ERIC|nr:hypothetical protein LOK49_LG02G03965 [Camellia lanceoleosa]